MSGGSNDESRVREFERAFERFDVISNGGEGRSNGCWEFER